jgi:hypothetical protein
LDPAAARAVPIGSDIASGYTCSWAITPLPDIVESTKYDLRCGSIRNWKARISRPLNIKRRQPRWRLTKIKINPGIRRIFEPWRAGH